MTTIAPWSGRAVMRARATVRRWLPAPCGKCGKPVNEKTPWVVGHKLDRNTHPHLTWDPTNWQPEHRACSDASGQAAVIAKARREGAASVQHSLFDAVGLRVLPADDPHGKTPPLPVSLPATGEPIEARPDLLWANHDLSKHAWTRDLLPVPGDSSPPLYMTPVPSDAVGSYGVEPCPCHGLTAIEWIEQAEKKALRWWQRLAVIRQLEHRADGSLCHSEIVESAPRRSGKSVRIRGIALWRMTHGEELFGEVQVVMHTGNSIPICREIQQGAWPWVRRTWGDDAITKANGKELVEAPVACRHCRHDEASHDGSGCNAMRGKEPCPCLGFEQHQGAGARWLVKAQDAVYGYDVHLGLGDECWAIRTDTFTEGIEPATMERPSAQVHLTSTAHRRATSLMRAKIMAELLGGVDDEDEEEDERALLLIWAAPHGSDPADPDVWRAASPHWSEDRRRLIRNKYRKALKGEVDPEADDPDPMAGFVAQYLNVWPIRAADVQRGKPIVTEHTWPPLAQAVPEGAPVAAAIESWFAAGVSLALAWRDGDQAVVSVTDHIDLADAVELLRESGYRGKVTVGASLVKPKRDPALKGLRVVAGEGRVGAAAGELTRLLAEDGIRHDGGEHLAEQLQAIRVVENADGFRLASTGRADALKAMVWAARAARSNGRGTGARVITGSS